ncbi:YihY/virulence factor BrkB family protein [Fastidiosipila sanguinis]|uniref:YihY/virulence factor BrkB family protein n=1 Tax=Fastidiosipila sanguinis TaxID=236753 RepID=A0A2S0KNF9_9FIRM|nr:YihY/virulence factor BrkB family protein [Fastidiosipila sanguinis]AVM42537.1 hypothetical protein C5Q98_04580 [Fastidiosipila sanguinis]
MSEIKEKKWFKTIQGIVNRFSEFEITTAAAASSYYFLFSIFPLILFTINLFSLINPELPELVKNSLPDMNLIIPDPVMNLLLNFMETAGESSKVSVMSFAGIGLLWSASGAIGNTIRTLNTIYRRESNNLNAVLTRALGMIFGLLFGLLLVVILLILSFSQAVINFIETFLPIPNFFKAGGFNLSAYFISFFVLVLVFIFVYGVMSKNRGGFLVTLISATFTSLAWLAISFSMSNIMVNNSRYDLIYGSLSSIIFLMLWMYLAVFSALIGAFIHTELIRYRQIKKMRNETINDSSDETKEEYCSE